MTGFLFAFVLGACVGYLRGRKTERRLFSDAGKGLHFSNRLRKQLNGKEAENELPA